MADSAVENVVENARKNVKDAMQHGRAAVDKAQKEARQAVKYAHKEPPLIHDSRLGELIDDPWSVARLMDLAVPSQSGHKRMVPGCDAELGAFPFPVNPKDHKLVMKATKEFLKLLKDCSEESLMEILEAEVDEDVDGIVNDDIFLKEGGIQDVNALARTFSRRRFGGKGLSGEKLQALLREKCLKKLTDPLTKLGRKAHQLVQNVNDLSVDVGVRAQVLRGGDVPLRKAGDRKAVVMFQGDLLAASHHAPEASEQEPSHGRSKAARTM